MRKKFTPEEIQELLSTLPIVCDRVASVYDREEEVKDRFVDWATIEINITADDLSIYYCVHLGIYVDCRQENPIGEVCYVDDSNAQYGCVTNFDIVDHNGVVLDQSETVQTLWEFLKIDVDELTHGYKRKKVQKPTPASDFEP